MLGFSFLIVVLLVLGNVFLTRIKERQGAIREFSGKV